MIIVELADIHGRGGIWNVGAINCLEIYADAWLYPAPTAYAPGRPSLKIVVCLPTTRIEIREAYGDRRLVISYKGEEVIPLV